MNVISYLILKESHVAPQYSKLRQVLYDIKQTDTITKHQLATLAEEIYTIKKQANLEYPIEFDILESLNIDIDDQTIFEVQVTDILESGKYTKDGQVFLVQEDTEAFDKILEIPLFEVQDVITKQRIITTNTNLQRL